MSTTTNGFTKNEQSDEDLDLKQYLNHESFAVKFFAWFNLIFTCFIFYVLITEVAVALIISVFGAGIVGLLLLLAWCAFLVVKRSDIANSIEKYCNWVNKKFVQLYGAITA